MLALLVAVVLMLGAVLAAIFGVLTLTGADTILQEIAGLLLLLIALGEFLGVVLCSVDTLLAKLIGRIDRVLESLERAEVADRGRAEVATERWETLVVSLGRLEGGVAEREKTQHLKRGEWDEAGLFGLSDANDSATSKPASIKCKCPRCGKTVKAGAEWAGRNGKCPACGAAIHFVAAPLGSSG
jgi:hypothetical protein